jgi:phage gp29-like protein
MADENQVVPPLPPPGEIVNKGALLLTQYALYRNTLAFGGTRNPSIIWSQMSRDDGSAMLYYRELEDKDTDVSNALDTLKESVLEREYSIQPFDESSQAAEIAAFVEQQLANVHNLDGVLDNMLDAPGYGFSLQELQFDVSMGQANLIDIKDCPQELFLFGDRFQPQIGNLQFLDSPYASTGVEVPEQKFLVYSHRPRSRNRMGRPLLRSVFWSSWFKRNIQRLWVRYAEKGPGTAVVKYSDANNAADKQLAAELAQALIDEVAVGVPEGFEYDEKLLTIARSQDPAVYEHFYSFMQLDIARRIQGETLTSFGGEGGKGTQALGKVHSETKDTRAIRLCKALQSVINWQLIRPMVLWNYGPNVPMPSWQYEVEEQEDLTKRLGIDSGLQRMGVPMPLSYLQGTYQVPAPLAGEEVATPNISAPETNITETTTAAFAEGAAATAALEMGEFDRVMAELEDDAKDLYKTRIREVTQTVTPPPAKVM